jgi:hypothetical protein
MTDKAIEQIVSHYAKMASDPATVEQARHSVAYLAKQWPEVFGDLGRLVKERIDAPRS